MILDQGRQPWRAVGAAPAAFGLHEPVDQNDQPTGRCPIGFSELNRRGDQVPVSVPDAHRLVDTGPASVCSIAPQAVGHCLE